MVRGRGDVPSSRPGIPAAQGEGEDTADSGFPAHHVELIHHAQQWAAVADDVERLLGLVSARSHCWCWADHRGPVAGRYSANRLSRTRSRLLRQARAVETRPKPPDLRGVSAAVRRSASVQVGWPTERPRTAADVSVRGTMAVRMAISAWTFH